MQTPHSPASLGTQADIARLALSCLDLTSLGTADTEADVARLCARAQSPFGPVAAVCVWPRFAALARRLLPREIAVAAVANFPDGSADVARAVRDTLEIVDSGAQEVDVVLPYQNVLSGDYQGAALVLKAVRAACPNQVLKVILETGSLTAEGSILTAARLALDCSADFLKTSTGKTKVSATVEAGADMLYAIAGSAGRDRVGFKASGGIRTVDDARQYIQLCGQFFGAEFVTKERFRIGASSLLDDIEAVLSGAGR